MRREWVFFLLSVVMAIAIACGGDDPTTPTDEGTVSAAPTATAVSSDVAPGSGGLGTLEVRVTDQPSPQVSAIVLTVQNVEVSTSGGAESGWQTVVEGPNEFDLLQLDGIEKILGSAQLEAGRYQQIRLEVIDAQVTIQNGVRSATIPSGKLRLVGGFEVVDGEKTIVTLDFDAEKSITFIPMRGPQLKPVVKLLVRKEGETLEEADEVAEIADEPVSGAIAATVERSASTQDAAVDGLTPVRVAMPTGNNLQFMSFWIAEGAGFFEDEGLAVEVIVPPNPTVTGNFLVQGGADVAVLPPPMFLPLIEQGAPILVFGNLIQNDAINLIVRAEIAAELNLSADASVKEKLEAIRGLRVGVAPGPPTRLRLLFESVGMSTDEDIEQVIVEPHRQNQAFGDGEIDALYAHTPYLETALVQQGAVMLINQSAGEVPELGGQRQGHSLVTTRSYAGDERDVLVAIIRAVQKAQNLIHNNLDDAVDAVLASSVPDLDRELVETIVGIYSPALPGSPVVSVEGVARAVELFPAHREPPDLSNLDLGDYVDTGVVAEAGS